MPKDTNSLPAKPPAHGTDRNHVQYEHEKITDNRQTWEVLEELDEKENS